MKAAFLFHLCLFECCFLDQLYLCSSSPFLPSISFSHLLASSQCASRWREAWEGRSSGHSLLESFCPLAMLWISGRSPAMTWPYWTAISALRTRHLLGKHLSSRRLWFGRRLSVWLRHSVFAFFLLLANALETSFCFEAASRSRRPWQRSHPTCQTACSPFRRLAKHAGMACSGSA